MFSHLSAGSDIRPNFFNFLILGNLEFLQISYCLVPILYLYCTYTYLGLKPDYKIAL